MREAPFSVIGKDGRFSTESGPDAATLAFKQQVYTQLTGGDWDAIPVEKKPTLSFPINRNSTLPYLLFATFLLQRYLLLHAAS